MTQNLRLENYTLTPEDSDVKSRFALPSSNTSGFDYWGNTGLYIYPKGITLNYGAQYNWQTATAGEGTRETVGSGKDMESSICPKGWRLPSKTDSDNLVSNYNWNTIHQNPANFVDAGRFYSGQLQDCGICGDNWIITHHWTSTASSGGVHAYSFVMHVSYISTMNGNIESYMGAAVRCISRDDK